MIRRAALNLQVVSAGPSFASSIFVGFTTFFVTSDKLYNYLWSTPKLKCESKDICVQQQCLLIHSTKF